MVSDPKFRWGTPSFQFKWLLNFAVQHHCDKAPLVSYPNRSTNSKSCRLHSSSFVHFLKIIIINTSINHIPGSNWTNYTAGWILSTQPIHKSSWALKVAVAVVSTTSKFSLLKTTKPPSPSFHQPPRTPAVARTTRTRGPYLLQLKRIRCSSAAVPRLWLINRGQTLLDSDRIETLLASDRIDLLSEDDRICGNKEVSFQTYSLSVVDFLNYIWLLFYSKYLFKYLKF
jgi:hypothetical protein